MGHVVPGTTTVWNWSSASGAAGSELRKHVGGWRGGSGVAQLWVALCGVAQLRVGVALG